MLLLAAVVMFVGLLAVVVVVAGSALFGQIGRKPSQAPTQMTHSPVTQFLLEAEQLARLETFETLGQAMLKSAKSVLTPIPTGLLPTVTPHPASVIPPPAPLVPPAPPATSLPNP